MLKISTETKLKPEEVIEKAIRFFGPNGGYGLQVTEQTDSSVCFEGGGGGIEVVACVEEKGTRVDVVSREWDYQAKEFMEKLH
jgi:hypothetical protein